MKHNFNPGPSALPECVRAQASSALACPGGGISVLEISHRSEQYRTIHDEALARFRSLYAVPEEFAIVLLQGGASLQFSMLPMNLLRAGRSADYVETGVWSAKALTEAKVGGHECRIAGSSRDQGFDHIPGQGDLDLDDAAEYLHLTTNNTIYGTQFSTLPDAGGVPIVADMSSDLLSRPIFWAEAGIGAAYGGAQKNAGVAGLTIVVIHKDLLSRERDSTPLMLRYSTHVEADSLYNTPPTFNVYVFGLVLKWVEAQGGLEAIDSRNRAKAAILYDVIDNSQGFYRGPAREGSRSSMNITFNLPTVADECSFLEEASRANMVGLAGPRSIGGVRVSAYNAMPVESCEALAELMAEFARRHG